MAGKVTLKVFAQGWGVAGGEKKKNFKILYSHYTAACDITYSNKYLKSNIVINCVYIQYCTVVYNYIRLLIYRSSSNALLLLLPFLDT
jgi:hypothetical protein